ncbi:hypothetical protein Tco_0925544 [Tanacetum coccineum]|uniref:Uncharacterized protein n=1 Tax=Tanacetum coccineum TaxID=301880 RepID=A0ABQ5D8D2_9ASTR
MDFYLHTNDQISLGCFQAFHCDAIMGQMLYQFQGNQRDYFSNNTFRGRSLVSSAVYYEVTPPNTFPLRHIFGGVTEGVNEAERKFAQLANDEEIARKVQEEWEAEEEKKKLAEEEATKSAFTNEYDFIQARLNADKILAKKLQEEEREKFTIEQRAKFLNDTIAAQRRFLAQQRSEAIRNKLPTRNQLRNQMMAYLKYVSEEPENTRVKAKIEEPKENIRKRPGRRLKIKAPKRSKRQKTDYDHEEENQLRTFLKIVLEEEEKIDYEVLGTRFIEQQIDEFGGQDGNEEDL